MAVKDSNSVGPKFAVGQKVVIQPVGKEVATKREEDIDQFAGKVGEVSEYYWISPREGQVFYIYSVLVSANRKEIVVYEDEIEPCLS